MYIVIYKTDAHWSGFTAKAFGTSDEALKFLDTITNEQLVRIVQPGQDA